MLKWQLEFSQLDLLIQSEAACPIALGALARGHPTIGPKICNLIGSRTCPIQAHLLRAWRTRAGRAARIRQERQRDLLSDTEKLRRAKLLLDEQITGCGLGDQPAARTADHLRSGRSSSKVGLIDHKSGRDHRNSLDSGALHAAEDIGGSFSVKSRWRHRIARREGDATGRGRAECVVCFTSGGAASPASPPPSAALALGSGGGASASPSA